MRHTLINKTKFTAKFLLTLWLVQILQPLSAYALTSGPSQPEAQSFQPVGMSDMVDLFSGDFKYNIPLMDIDGYPINLNYQSGVGIDDEASWVGLGWNLNTGSINRQIKGMPDDFAGDDVVTEHYTKPKVTVGGKLSAKYEFKGNAKIGGSLSLGVFSDNYTGIGAEVGANAGMSFSLSNDGMFTAGLGIGVLSNTASGAEMSVSPYISLAIAENAKYKNLINSGLSSSFGYNTRSGLKALTFGSNFLKGNLGTTTNINFNTEPILPKVQIPYKTNYGSFSVDLGAAAFLNFAGGGVTGYRSIREVASKKIINPGYGFLYAELGKNKNNAVMDFIREKDNPITPELPNVALPVHTPDAFSYTSQNGSGQFRLYRGGTGAFFDAEAIDQSDVVTAGFDLGGGAYFHGGVTFFEQNTSNKTRKWIQQNEYIKNADFQDADFLKPKKQNVFFKKIGEINIEDSASANMIGAESLLSISTSGKVANSAVKLNLAYGSNIKQIPQIEKNNRQPQSTTISYLTAKEALVAGLDKKIKSYSFNNYGTFQPAEINNATEEDRVNTIKKAHHISELTVNNSDGKRMVYGIPVYNLAQEEYSFAIGDNYNSNNGLLELKNGIEGGKGYDHYYHKDSQSPYAYNYLLTAVLSADYLDKTGNGITDDDNGTAIKFNYSKLENYKWRTPYKNMASVNRGLLADADDDKATILYGEKEIYYVHSIESKTKIAYFITTDRLDALGVENLQGNVEERVRQKCLKEIRLYSKANREKPIKIVKFKYNYDLCRNTPNSKVTAENPNGGKLTLEKVWFEYGFTEKGSNHPYVFTYNKQINGVEVSYGTMQTDRWGTYKNPTANLGGFNNEEFPYANQNKLSADESASLWNLKTIEIPSGGTIDVKYESDDYSYVQNKKAMEMVPFQVIGSPGTLKNSSGIKIKISEMPPSGPHKEWFIKNYLNGADYIYTKSRVKISNSNAPSHGRDYDYVPVYCKIRDVLVRNGYAEITFEPINEANLQINPLRHGAWQRMKNEYPKYAYPGYQNRVKDGSGDIGAVVSAISNAVGNLAELKENFYQKANRKNYANEIDESKSFAKIAKSTGFKLGGGARVKKITISDNWNELSDGGSIKGIYGQSYDYTTLENGNIISSGVASNEPSVGNDENPLKKTVPYIEKIKGAINNYLELEEPFGESFYPPPGVGYSKVTVRDLESGGTEVATPKTGFTVNEFYTAKNFPVKVSFSPIKKYNPKPSREYSLIRTQSFEELVMSQGYLIELNDMHGKIKEQSIYNQGGNEVSSVKYNYLVDDSKSLTPNLVNEVDVVDQGGNIVPSIMGREIEFFTDFREQVSLNSGRTVNIGLDVFPGFIIPIPVPHFPFGDNNEYKLFRSACAVKVIQRAGILKQIVKRENGSSISTENIAFDGITGEALVTKTQNEFKGDYYSVNLPAYWAYDRMGGAYKNLGIILKNLSINQAYEINNEYRDIFVQGDELINISTGEHYWVADNKLINRAGRVLKYIDGAVQNYFKIVRSGYRNLLDASVGSVVYLNNPINNKKLNLNSNSKELRVLNASAITYDDKWAPTSLEKKYETIEVERDDYYIWAKLEETNWFQNRDWNWLGTRSWTYNYATIELKFYKSYSNTTPPLFIDENLVNWTGTVNLHSMYSNSAFQRYINNSKTKIIQNESPYPGSNTISLVFYYYKNKFPFGGAEYEDHHCYIRDIYGNIKSLSNGNALEEAQTSYGVVSESKNIIYGTFQVPFNPFVEGYIGNWSPSETKVYQIDRQYNNAELNNAKTLNIKDAGYFKSFSSYWGFNNNFTSPGLVSSPVERWVTSNKITQYDKYGQELENKDALNRYSAANFDFKGQLPSSVASNAKNREIYVNSFEDKGRHFVIPDTNTVKEFVSKVDGQPLSSSILNSVAHTGNYSLLLPAGGIALYTIKHDEEQKVRPYLAKNNNGEFVLPNNFGLYPRGFEPAKAKNYIFNIWVRDNQPQNKSINISAVCKSSNNFSLPISLKCKAIVEGWKLLEGEFNTGFSSNYKFDLILTPNYSGIYIDDIRIHPKDAHLKSYTYDDRNFKLMAELDENAFATFYEYDDEGSLIRVKKETERGIATIKENRSSYRKKRENN